MTVDPKTSGLDGLRELSAPMFTPRSARDRVSHAVKLGVLTRPTSCERCGASPSPGKDGRTRIHGHHADYSKPLSVEWLCTVCHRATIHPVHAKGEAVGTSKLSVDAVIDIRRKRMNQRAYGRLYGVSQTLISLIQLRKWWDWVPDERAAISALLSEGGEK